VARFEYDDEASAVEQTDVVYEVTDDGPCLLLAGWSCWRRLNGMEDPLARRLLALHRDGGSGMGACDNSHEEPVPISQRSGWGCETIEAIADHLDVDYPKPPTRG
jgi:hypothetical protein